MAGPRIFICSASRQEGSRSAHLAAQLSRDLSNAGAEIVAVLARCEWVLLLQSHELLQSAASKALVQQALKHDQLGQLRGIIRIIVETDPSQAIPSEWIRLPTVDGQRRYEEALEALKAEIGLGHPSLAKRPEPVKQVMHSADARLPLTNQRRTVPLTSFAEASSTLKTAVGFDLAGHWQPSTNPSSSLHLVPPPPIVKPVVRPAKTRWWLVAIMLGLTGLILSALLLVSSHSSTRSPVTKPVVNVIGTASLYSSNMFDPGGSSGINDGVQIDLSLPQPRTGENYFAWLLPDPSNTEGEVVFLGRLTTQDGQAHLQYMDPSHRNLLGWTSRFLVTEDNSSVIPDIPSPDQSTWKYFAEFPQQPNQADMMGHYSLLDHLRHLLVEQPDLLKKGLHGGLALWLRQNTQKILEWASAARGTGIPQAPSLLRRQLVRILDYIDGLPYVAPDVPPHTPSLVEGATGQFGLLTLDPQAMPPGYIQHVEMHLAGLIGSPGATTGQRKLATHLDMVLTIVKGDLEQARHDAIKLLSIPTDQLRGPNSIALLNDLVENINNAYVGHYDPNSGARQGGVMFVYDQLQHLATFDVRAYRV